MTDLDKDIERALEFVEVLKATVPSCVVELAHLELVLEECKAIADVPVLTETA